MFSELKCFKMVIKAPFHPLFSPRIRVVSRVLDLELLCIPRERIQDQIRNMRWEQNDELSCDFLSRCCAFLRTCGNKSALQ